VWGDSKVVAQPSDTGWAEQIDFDGLVEWAVKRHRGSGVDDRVDRAHDLASLIIESESIHADVTANGGDTSGTHLLKRLTTTSHRLAEAVKCIVCQNFPLGATRCRCATAIAHEQHQ
jgi:hypothetical protein